MLKNTVFWDMNGIIISQNTAFCIVTAIETSNCTTLYLVLFQYYGFYVVPQENCFQISVSHPSHTARSSKLLCKAENCNAVL
jgi:hypothetical protein